MNKLNVFISSVQREFADERRMLYDYLLTDALLGRFFEPFIFEQLPAVDRSAAKAYEENVRKSDVYLGIFGKEYGYTDTDDISPTEREFDLAEQEHKIRLVFISRHKDNERDPRELKLIKKAENALVRKKFSDASELKTLVYAALVNLLEEKELIRTVPFDATLCKDASMDDIDPERVRWFVTTARSKRGFPLSPESPSDEILTHLNLLRDGRLTSSAVLLFGKQPQRFFITSEVRCAMFHGNDVVKPIPSYQVYKGDLFRLVDDAVDFIMSRIDLYVGDRSRSVDVPVEYEIPRSAVTEAVVNAVAHRDYTSNGSVQVMLFRNRVEIWNPGRLPHHLTIPKLKEPHGSYPANPLIAEPLYLAGYIERMGTGIPDMIKACIKAGLKEPELVQEETFKTILWRQSKVTDQVTDQVERLLVILEKEMTRQQLMDGLALKHGQTFRENYLRPALQKKWIEMTNPENPNDPNQKYRLTDKGRALKKELQRKKRK